MATPCSVKAIGLYLSPILWDLEITSCDLKLEVPNLHPKTSGNPIVMFRIVWVEQDFVGWVRLLSNLPLLYGRCQGNRRNG